MRGRPAMRGAVSSPSTTEHKCVLESVADLKDEGFEPVFLPVRPDGLLDPDVLRAALGVPTLLVSVMAREQRDRRDPGYRRSLRHGPCGRRPVSHGRGTGNWQDPDRRGRDGHRSDVHQRPQDLRAQGRRRALRSSPSARTPRAAVLGWRTGAGTRAPARCRLRWSSGSALPAVLRLRRWRGTRSGLASFATISVPVSQPAVPGLVLNGSESARIAGNLNLTFPHAFARRADARAAGSVRLDRVRPAPPPRWSRPTSSARSACPTRRPRAPCASASDALPPAPTSRWQQMRSRRRTELVSHITAGS